MRARMVAFRGLIYNLARRANSSDFTARINHRASCSSYRSFAGLNNFDYDAIYFEGHARGTLIMKFSDICHARDRLQKYSIVYDFEVVLAL